MGRDLREAGGWRNNYECDGGKSIGARSQVTAAKAALYISVAV